MLRSDSRGSAKGPAARGQLPGDLEHAELGGVGRRPDGQRWQGRVFPALSEYAPSEWLGSGFEHAHARKLSAAEREAMRVQIADAESEFRMCMARKGPRSPGVPRVDVRVECGLADRQRQRRGDVQEPGVVPDEAAGRAVEARERR